MKCDEFEESEFPRRLPAKLDDLNPESRSGGLFNPAL
jgi:hypothetical protein